MKQTAKLLRINQSELTEHLLEVAMYQIDKTLKDPEKRKVLETHLEKRHLLGGYDSNEAAVLILGESGQNWLLIVQTRVFIYRTNKFIQAMKSALKTGDLKRFEIEQKKLLREVLMYTQWISKLAG